MSTAVPVVGDDVTVCYSRRDPSTWVRARVVGLAYDRFRIERLTTTWPFGGFVGDPDHTIVGLDQIISVNPQDGGDLLDLLEAP